MALSVVPTERVCGLYDVDHGSLRGSEGGSKWGSVVDVALSTVLNERVWSVWCGAFRGAEGALTRGVCGGDTPPRCSPWCRRSEYAVYGVNGGAFRGAEEGGSLCGGVLWQGGALSVVLKHRGASGDWSSKPS